MTYVSLDRLSLSNNIDLNTVKYRRNFNFCENALEHFQYLRGINKYKKYKYCFFRDKFYNEDINYSTKVLHKAASLDLNNMEEMAVFCIILRYIKKNKEEILNGFSLHDLNYLNTREIYWSEKVKELIGKKEEGLNYINLLILHHFLKNEKDPDLDSDSKFLSTLENIEDIINSDQDRNKIAYHLREIMNELLYN